MKYFKGKTIWITGASSGIGEQIACALAPHAGALILSARNAAALELVKRKCSVCTKVIVLPFDLADEQAITQSTTQAYDAVGRIDILFNNGGVSQRASALDTNEEVERQMFQINYFSNVFLAKLVTQRMIEHGGGHLVITSSLLGKWGFHLRSTYAATKHALHGFYDSLRFETESQGMLISLVLPGFIRTEISVHAMDGKGAMTGEMDANQAGGISPEACAKKILDGVARKKSEFGVGGKELLGLKLRRFFPSFFQGILRKKSAR
ncbi:MAG: SDR family NAD(P)-dependent oxidoreductase [Flavobacteriales bacterium]